MYYIPCTCMYHNINMLFSWKTNLENRGPYDLRSNQVDLAWNKARTVEDSEVYQVFYKSLREDKGWKTSRNETKAASMLVDSLTPDTAYIFQIRIMDKYSQTYYII